MGQKPFNEAICLKQYLTDKEYEEINKLQELSYSIDKTNLKLELGYRLTRSRSSEPGLKSINEFLYYIDEALVAYLNISNFGGNIGEINGLTHPDWRRKGLFKRLFDLAQIEGRNRNFSKLLLLSDGKSNSGIEFIKAVGGRYDISEYRMKLINNTYSEGANIVTLRAAGLSDLREIRRQNSIYFDDNSENDGIPLEEDPPNEITYIAELKGETIGKIKIEFDENSAFICGFGILPDYRGKGYGKAALKEALRLISSKNIHEVALDVACTNNSALNLYQSCGFVQQSVMDYYQFS